MGIAERDSIPLVQIICAVIWLYSSDYKFALLCQLKIDLKSVTGEICGTSEKKPNYYSCLLRTILNLLDDNNML